MSANTPASDVASALLAKSNAAVVAGTPGVTTPPKAKAAKPPKASPPGAKGVVPSKTMGSTLIVFEPGIQTIALKDIDWSIESNTTRPEGLGKPEDLKELMAQLKATGQLVPGIVQRVKGGKKPYRGCAGFRRAAAIAANGSDTMFCRIEASGTDEMRVLVNITENEDAKKPITALGRLHGYEALLGMGHPISEVAALAGNAEDFVRDVLRITNGAPEIREALALPEGKEGAMSFGVARLILRKGKDGRSIGTSKVTEDDLKEQVKLFKKCQPLSVAATREFLAEYYGTVKPETDEKDEKGEKKGAKDDSEHTYAEGRIVKATVPFIVRYEDAAAAMDAATTALSKALESTGLKIPPVTDAQKAIEKAANAMVKAMNMQITALTNLLGEKAYKTALKAVEKASDED